VKLLVKKRERSPNWEKNKQTDQPKLTVNEEHEKHTRAVASKNKETLLSLIYPTSSWEMKLDFLSHQKLISTV
jgi:hypothetical protein